MNKKHELLNDIKIMDELVNDPEWQSLTNGFK